MRRVECRPSCQPVKTKDVKDIFGKTVKSKIQCVNLFSQFSIQPRFSTEIGCPGRPILRRGFIIQSPRYMPNFPKQLSANGSRKCQRVYP